jgi:hypothetical protein
MSGVLFRISATDIEKEKICGKMAKGKVRPGPVFREVGSLAIDGLLLWYAIA